MSSETKTSNINPNEKILITDPNLRISNQPLNKNEITAILSKRSNEISNNAPFDGTLLDEIPADKISSYNIAQLELQYGLIPYEIYRKIGQNTYEVWQVSELTYRIE
jgi:hypothetical protein